VYGGLPGAVCNNPFNRRSVSCLEFRSRVDQLQHGDASEDDTGKGVRVRYVKPGSDGGHPCPAFPVNAIEAGTNGSGNKRVYARAVEQVYRMGIK